MEQIILIYLIFSSSLHYSLNYLPKLLLPVFDDVMRIHMQLLSNKNFYWYCSILLFFIQVEYDQGIYKIMKPYHMRRHAIFDIQSFF